MIRYFNAKDIYDDMRRKRQLYPIQHIGPNGYIPECNCSLCEADRIKEANQ